MDILMDVALIANVVTCFSAAMAAWFWWKAASASVAPEDAANARQFLRVLSPDPDAANWTDESNTDLDHKGKAYDVSATMALQGKWNSRAAGWACVAAVGQSAVYLIGLFK